jgi:ABC-type nitrate/sulfonate/bicarbonate transport system substrate-binding protein
MIKINIGGVNEHFNFPWKHGIETNAFYEQGIDLQWHDIAGGTGEMVKLLVRGDLQLAVLLTEGFYFSLATHTHSVLLSNFTDTPLKWGVFVHKKSAIDNLQQIFNKKFAVSRLGSGSHLMVIVFAQQNNKHIQNMRFVEKHSLSGCLHAIKNHEADVFLWEKYTTKPFIQDYELKHIGDIPTPWPAFSIVCNKEFYSKNTSQVKTIINTIFKLNSNINSNKKKYAPLIANQSQLPVDWIMEWIAETTWAEKNILNDRIEKNIKNIFTNAGLIK